MAGHTFFGKQKLCYTEVDDFTDFQGIGHDPMYKRYDSVFSVVKRAVPDNLQHFLATPEYLDDEDKICWHVEKWKERPVRLTELSGEECEKYKGILDDTVKQYKSSIMNLNGEDVQIMANALKYIDNDRVYCGDDKVYLVAWGMTPDVRKHKVIGSVIHDFPYVKKYKVTFDAGEHGTVSKLDKSVNRAEGTTLTQLDVPEVSADEGWKFSGWSPSPIGKAVNSDMTFTAQYTEDNTYIPPVPPTPPVPPIEDIDEEEEPVVEKEPAPVIKEEVPWYKRWFLGLWTGKGCLKWLLWMLITILLIWLLSWLLRGCVGCSGPHSSVNGVAPIDTITRSDGRQVDDNGITRPIAENDGSLPDDNMIVAPVMGEGGEEPPIVEQPGAPSVIGNRLFLFLEEEKDDVEALAHDFKKAYPDEKYSIIGYDKEVRLLVIQMPENERDHIRQTINSKIPNHKFLVFDEEVYEINGYESSSTANAGWHLNAIHLKQGWAYTKGSSDVKVAVVDDGIQASHPMFRGRIVDAYNVFKQNNSLSVGVGHGTHTAGLAAGSVEYYSKGASGVAPNCKIMPVQVVDNGHCPLSALVAGVMYALHHDADVVNISIGPSFKGLNTLPVAKQAEIAKTQFKNVAYLWERICKLAARKNTILVFAAGNDNILSSIPPENRNASSIVVTALNKEKCPTEFTNYGPCSDISAPGKDICSSFPMSTLKCMDGTSMATPIVSGTIALMKSIKKNLTVEQARNALYSTGADVYGNIPPMVLVDKVLAATKKGDFRRTERRIQPLPNDRGSQTNSGKTPVEASVDKGMIRRQIAEYKKKIEELEKLLQK